MTYFAPNALERKLAAEQKSNENYKKVEREVQAQLGGEKLYIMNLESENKILAAKVEELEKALREIWNITNGNGQIEIWEIAKSALNKDKE